MAYPASIRLPHDILNILADRTSDEDEIEIKE